MVSIPSSSGQGFQRVAHYLLRLIILQVSIPSSSGQGFQQPANNPALRCWASESRLNPFFVRSRIPTRQIDGAEERIKEVVEESLNPFFVRSRIPTYHCHYPCSCYHPEYGASFQSLLRQVKDSNRLYSPNTF